MTDEAKDTFWISWYHDGAMGIFELHSPWWTSGYSPGEHAQVICAAVRSEHPDAAIEAIRQSYDDPPETLRLRFCKKQPPDWEPFSDRFPRRDWMQW